jgi:hypothetical protein
MTRGTILNAARSESKGAVLGSAIFLALCLAVLGINWRYVYNFVTGPHEFTPSVSASPGAKEFVRATGRIVPTGIVQETTLRLLRGLAETKSVTAQYLAMQVGDKILLVKVDPSFAGQTVEGRLVPLPESVHGSLPKGTPVHPWMIEATTGYRWDFNLFVMIAAPLAVLSMILLIATAWSATNVNRHSAFKRLKSKGDAAQIAMKVEDELISARTDAKAGPFYITKSWMVALKPVLLIYPMTDLMGVGHKEKTTKSGTRHSLIVWQRGVNLNDIVSCNDEADSTAVITRLAEKCPWVLVSDPDSFDKRWRQQRQQTEKEVDERRLHVSRAG